MIKTFLITVLAITILLAAPAYSQTHPVSPVQNPLLPKAIEQVEALATAELAKENIGGITIGIVSGGKLVWTKSYGYADTERKNPTTKDHVFGIGSITKQFTALMLLQLVERGKVRLSDPVEKYVPEVNKLQKRFAGAPPITLTGARARWAIVRSTTKFLGPDLRVALVAGDELTLARMRGRQAVSTRWVSHVLQYLALALWSDPSSGRQLARASDTYAQRREALIAALAAHRVEVKAPSGLNVWIPVRHESLVVEQLAERGWAVAARERFRLQSGPGIRVTTSALAPEAAVRFAADLVSAMREGPPVLA